MQLNRRGDISEVGHRGNAVPEPWILLRSPKLAQKILARATAEGWRRPISSRRVPVLEKILVGGGHPSPDHSHLDPRIDDERSQCDVAPPRVFPHPDPAGVGRRVPLEARYSIQDVNRVVG